MGLSGRDLLLAGATGLVGGLVLRRLLASRDFDGTIYAPVRRELGIDDPQLVQLRTDFGPGSGDLQLSAEIRGRTARPVDLFVSCLGTTIRAAGRSSRVTWSRWSSTRCRTGPAGCRCPAAS